MNWVPHALNFQLYVTQITYFPLFRIKKENVMVEKKKNRNLQRNSSLTNKQYNNSRDINSFLQGMWVCLFIFSALTYELQILKINTFSECFSNTSNKTIYKSCFHLLIFNTSNNHHFTYQNFHSWKSCVSPTRLSSNNIYHLNTLTTTKGLY